MKLSYKKGFSFGLTSGIITTLGLMVGLYSSTESKMVVLGGIFMIAIADAMSDSLGIHVAEESVKENTHRQVWESTLSAFFSKFIYTLTFVIPVLIFDLNTAIIVGIIWGFVSLIFINYFIAKLNGKRSWKIILEHVSIAAFVVIASYYVGQLISYIFN